MQIVRILKRANQRSLVLLDELGAGTDPQEGSALARAVLSALLSRKITCMVATHYPELKTFAHATRGVLNASLEFDVETLKPTYHLTMGLPGRSNALAIAERLGLDRDIIEDARQELNPTDLRAEDLLEEIHRQRELTQANYAESEKLRRELEARQRELNARLEELEAEKSHILEHAQDQAEQELEQVRQELAELRREMSRLRTSPAELAPLVEKLEEVAEKQEKSARKQRQPRITSSSGPLRVGEKVLVRRLKTEGVITALDDDEVEVQAGVLRMRLRPEEFTRRVQTDEEALEEPAKPVIGRTQLPEVASPGMELDLRGQRVEDALDQLDTYLERASQAGLPFSRIIHGKGTGALRQAVREVLQTSRYVKRWEPGGEKEGGDGVSVVFFEGH
jgi:DNA mismatch repair protein MutS2